ncbi:PREDICTED: LOW QUALITY PROTEIN: testis-expressed sequence 43 protein, partial [Buceros rhinoceros silvestris]|uniref:LOW QUALITY PROTEIN: testis-expressed sequence 43 protein n=1 Tax=Buceros rhinoceros silvestris TaxID=175836 RepID=UPI0005282D73
MGRIVVTSPVNMGLPVSALLILSGLQQVKDTSSVSEQLWYFIDSGITSDKFCTDSLQHRNVHMQHATLAEIYTGALEESLFLEHRGRLCRGDERKTPWEMLVADILVHSHISRSWAAVIALACRKLRTCFFLLQTRWN